MYKYSVQEYINGDEFLPKELLADVTLIEAVQCATNEFPKQDNVEYRIFQSKISKGLRRRKPAEICAVFYGRKLKTK